MQLVAALIIHIQCAVRSCKPALHVAEAHQDEFGDEVATAVLRLGQVEEREVEGSAQVLLQGEDVYVGAGQLVGHLCAAAEQNALHALQVGAELCSKIWLLHPLSLLCDYLKRGSSRLKPQAPNSSTGGDANHRREQTDQPIAELASLNLSYEVQAATERMWQHGDAEASLLEAAFADEEGTSIA